MPYPPSTGNFLLDTFQHDPDEPELGLGCGKNTEIEIAAGGDDELILCRLKDQLVEVADLHLLGDLHPCPPEIFCRSGHVLEVRVADGLDREAFEECRYGKYARLADDLPETGFIEEFRGD